MMAPAWVICRPLCITPNARARYWRGSACTNRPLLAGTRPATQAPHSTAIVATTMVGGFSSAGARVTGISTANGRISLRRVSGGTNRLMSSPPMKYPNGTPIMIRPWASPWCAGSRVVAQAAANPSGGALNRCATSTVIAMARRTGVPKTTRNPWAVSFNRCVRCAWSNRAGRARTQRATRQAENRNVPASISSARRGWIAASAAPDRYPTTCAAWPVLCWVARPTTYRSPSRIRGSRADRDASKGGLNSAARNSTTSIAQIGMCGMATSAMSPARTRSQLIITARCGYRSASAASTGPPTTQGRKLIANAAADAVTECDCRYTSAVTAALAMKSPTQESALAA